MTSPPLAITCDSRKTGGARTLPFPPVDVGEDGCASQVVSHDVDDDRGVFVHVEHGANTAPVRGERAATATEADLDPGTAALLRAFAPRLKRGRRRRRGDKK